MQINLGEKIKELRKRDGRKQEDLANALGVTAQAVSRWEANGGYPDMGMIPAIANYFHITIDELFGYNNDRDTKIKDYATKANRLLIDNDGDITECIQLMKKALEEFPSEPELQMYLAHALNSKGSQEAEKPNMYLEEAAALYEELSKQNNKAIIPLLSVYTMMGEYEKAEKKALEQPGVQMSREVLLVSIFDGKKGERYRGEAILALLHELRLAIEFAIVRNEKLVNSKEGIEISLLVRHLYEKILGEEYCGDFNSDLCMLDLSCVKIAANMKDYDQALTFFDSAYEHYTKFAKRLTDVLNEGFEEEHFDTPLLSEVGNISIPIIVCRPEFLKNSISSLPEEVKAQISNNSKYAGLFEE